jgi:hypothetical protein
VIRAVLFCAGLLAPLAAGAQTAPQTQAGGPLAGPAETEALRLQIGSYWNLGDASASAPRVVLRVTFAPDGRVADVALIGSDAASAEATEAAFQAARRAVLRADAAGLVLPDGVVEGGLELVFDPGAGLIR